MPLSTYSLIQLIVEIIFYSFHFSMFILMILKRKSVFVGPFYGIFKMVLFADFLFFISITFVQKLRLIPVILDIFIDNMYLITVALLINTYVTSMQFIGHLLLAFNRFTIICFPTSYNKIWERQWYIFILIILPFFPICWRLHEPIIFKFASDGEVTAAAFLNSNVAKMSNILQSVIFITTTFLAAILNILSFMKFIFHKSNHGSSINVKEKHLLYVSFVTFISQCLRITYNINGTFFASNFDLVTIFNALLPILNDIFAWSGVVSILFLSSSTRKAYKKFYLCKSDQINVHTNGSKSHVANVSKITMPKNFPTIVSSR